MLNWEMPPTTLASSFTLSTVNYGPTYFFPVNTVLLSLSPSLLGIYSFTLQNNIFALRFY